MQKNIYLGLFILLATVTKFSQCSEIKMSKFKDNIKQVLRSENVKYEEDFLDHFLDQYFKDALKTNPTPVIEVNDAKIFLEEYKKKMEEELLDFYNIDLSDTDYISLMRKNPKKYGLTFKAYKILVE